MKILIYVPQFCIYSAIAGINDIFWIANNIIKSKNLLNLKNLSEINEFKVELVSIDGKPVVNAQNKMIDVDLSIEEAINSDLIIVPGMMLSDEQTPIMPSEYKAVLEWLQNENIKKTSELLRSAANSGDLNFHGNVEGHDIFKGTTDIVVCDGFVGNVALDRKSTRLNSSHMSESRMPSSA